MTLPMFKPTGIPGPRQQSQSKLYLFHCRHGPRDCAVLADRRPFLDQNRDTPDGDFILLVSIAWSFIYYVAYVYGVVAVLGLAALFADTERSALRRRWRPPVRLPC